MKEEIASFEIMHLLKELEFLNNSKVEKIYDVDNGILIVFHVRNKGKQMLRINNKFFYLTSKKEEMSDKPSNFCLILRKHLENSKLKGIEQRDFERFVELLFETNHGIHRLIVELFGRGNIILCMEDYTIIIPLRIEKWERCVIKPKNKYVFPKQRFDFLNINVGALKEMFNLTKQESVVKSLAIDLGLGGIYSEELCLISKIDKNKNPKTLSDDEIAKIFESIMKLRTAEKNPTIVYENNKIVDVVPISLSIYESKEKKHFESYNEALDFVFSEEIFKIKEEEIEKRINKEIERIKKIIELQERNLNEIESEIKENQEKANLIYQNYALVSEILREIKKAREKYSWQEIKERLKGHKIIKEINERTGDIIIEI